MAPLRRRLASWALVLTVLQCGLLFTAPVTACCGRKAETAIDCCPAGSHAPGECPLHKAARSADCAFRCDASHAPDFVLGTIGILAAPVQQLPVPVATPLAAFASIDVTAPASHPDAPPPKAL